MTIGLAYDVSQEVGVWLGCARVEPQNMSVYGGHMAKPLGTSSG